MISVAKAQISGWELKRQGSTPTFLSSSRSPQAFYQRLSSLLKTFCGEYQRYIIDGFYANSGEATRTKILTSWQRLAEGRAGGLDQSCNLETLPQAALLLDRAITLITTHLQYNIVGPYKEIDYILDKIGSDIRLTEVLPPQDPWRSLDRACASLLSIRRGLRNTLSDAPEIKEQLKLPVVTRKESRGGFEETMSDTLTCIENVRGQLEWFFLRFPLNELQTACKHRTEQMEQKSKRQLAIILNMGPEALKWTVGEME